MTSLNGVAAETACQLGGWWATCLRTLSGVAVLTGIVPASHAGLTGTPVPPNVVVWGDGQCGLWDVPIDAFPIVQLSAGINHIVALRADGAVFGWGCHPGPPDGLEGAVQVAAGGHGHSAAVLSNGALVMWGDNSDGQCDVPPDLGAISRVSCGAAHTAVLLPDGTVRAWGNNGLGQCDVPEGLASVVAIQAGGRHTLALRSDGTVVCWGFACAVPAGLDDVVAIDSGYDSALAIRSDGSVLCVAGGGAVCEVPRQLPTSIAVAAAVEGSAAVDSDGKVRVWGSVSPELHPPPNLRPAAAITAGWGVFAIVEPADCNDNGQDDTLEILSGLAPDCNGNWIPDACESLYRRRARASTPFGADTPHILELHSPPASEGAVEVMLTVVANLEGRERSVVASIDGQPFGSAFATSGGGCESESQHAVLHIDQALFNAAAADGLITITLEASDQVTPSECTLTWAELAIAYPIEAQAPSCDCPADLTGDLTVDGSDLAVILAEWGSGVPGTPSDFDNNGVVDGADLTVLLGSWGPCQ